MKRSVELYLGLGSNILPQIHLRRALGQLAQWPQTRVLRISDGLRSKPLAGCPVAQPDFINVVVALETFLSLDQVFERTQALERAHGRLRTIHWGPRTLDVDILLYGEERRADAHLTIPHARLQERDFVLEPLAAIHGTGWLPDGRSLKVLGGQLAPDQKHILEKVALGGGGSMATQLPDLRRLKAVGEKITALTAYDATMAEIFSNAGVDVLLVGDSLGSVIQGHVTTLPVTLDEMVYHTRCVARGNQGAWLMADMPFMSYTNPAQACEHAARLMQAGAQMVKLEGGQHLVPVVEALSTYDIPVCIHLGLRPQAVHALGGYKVQGRDAASAERILIEGAALEAAGARCCVLECVPSAVAARLAAHLQIPVIGIGAGAEVDGQILVSYDLLGMNARPARFVENFLACSEQGIFGAVAAYVQAVKAGDFPQARHCYG